MTATTTPAPDDAFDGFLRHAGLIADGDTPRYTPLTGGVSSDIWRVDLSDRTICIKRALAKLRVADDWFAPISRNATEVAWLETVAKIVPGAAPRVLAHDAEAGMFAMAFIPPEQARTWKELLRDGTTDPAFADAVGRALAAIHARSSEMPELAARFATDDAFHAIRLEPYLETTARRHPDVAAQLNELVAVTAATKVALVHGDVSPKNILVASSGPVFIDAECAWWGDPAFDLAFCLNHFLLKCLWVPANAGGYLACFDAMVAGYRETMPAVFGADTEARAAPLLPGLFLARIDGKSPVEYITDDDAKNMVRDAAQTLLIAPPTELAAVRRHWTKTIGDSA